MNARSFHLSAQGASHIKKNKECQDSSLSFENDSYAIAIVCDGHGGDDYVRSAVGSRLACEITEQNIQGFVESINAEELRSKSTEHIKTLEASIINAWNEAIYAHYEEHEFTDSETTVLSPKAKKRYLEDKRIESAYGTTLIAVVVTHEYWFGIHIGDGKCVAISPEGKFVQPIPWDSKCFLNATTSICDTDALNSFRHFYSEKLPVAVFVGSDGIDDCFNSTQQLNNLYKTVLYSFATSDFDEAVSGLADYLPRLSAKGSGDDVSIAAVLDLDSIGQIEAVRDFDEEKEKARVEENARREAEKAEEERKRIDEEYHRKEAERAERERKKREEAERADRERKKREEAKRSAGKTEERPSAKRMMRYCTYCGERLMPGMLFCGHCGKTVLAPIPEPEEIIPDIPVPVSQEPPLSDPIQIVVVEPAGVESVPGEATNDSSAALNTETVNEGKTCPQSEEATESVSCDECSLENETKNSDECATSSDGEESDSIAATALETGAVDQTLPVLDSKLQVEVEEHADQSSEITAVLNDMSATDGDGYVVDDETTETQESAEDSIGTSTADN